MLLLVEPPKKKLHHDFFVTVQLLCYLFSGGIASFNALFPQPAQEPLQPSHPHPHPPDL